jgi:hypothetical protein
MRHIVYFLHCAEYTSHHYKLCLQCKSKSFQIVLQSEWLITHITGVWILSITLLPECFITHITGVQPLPKMYMLMHVQSSPVCEWFTTHITLYGCSPLCLHWCIFGWCSTLNDLQHTSQAYEHSPLCTCWCSFKITLLPEGLIIHITGIQVLCTTYTLLSLHNIHLTVSAQYYVAWVLYYTHHWVLDNPC